MNADQLMIVDFGIIMLVGLLIVGFIIYGKKIVAYRNKLKSSHLRTPKDVKNGEKILITKWSQNTTVDCLNNNPVDKKMFVRVYFKSKNMADYSEDHVYPYSDTVFKDFSTLNPVVKMKSVSVKGRFVEQERFEEAKIIKEAIEKLKELKTKKQLA